MRRSSMVESVLWRTHSASMADRLARVASKNVHIANQSTQGMEKAVK